jgi:hypothetical protein
MRVVPLVDDGNERLPGQVTAEQQGVYTVIARHLEPLPPDTVRTVHIY